MANLVSMYWNQGWWKEAEVLEVQVLVGCSMGTVYTAVLRLRCWWVRVWCLNFDTAAYTAPITAVVMVFSRCLAHMVL